MYTKALVATLLVGIVAAVPQSPQQTSKYEADIMSLVNGLATQSAVFQAYQALATVEPALYSSILTNPAGALAGATTGTGLPAYITLLPSSAQAVFISIDEAAASLYSKDLGQYVTKSGTAATATAASASAPASSSTGAAASMGVGSLIGAAAGAVGLAAALL